MFLGTEANGVCVVDQHPHASSPVPLGPSFIPPAAPVFVAPPATQISAIPVLSTSLPDPPALVTALKIMKRKRPDPATASGTPGLPVEALDSVDDGQSSSPPTVVRTTPVASTIQSVGRFAAEGQGPMRVPNPSSDREKVGATGKYHKPIGTTLAGPRRVPLPIQAPAAAAPPAKAPSYGAQSTSGPGLKRPLRLVPPNGSASSVPRAVVGTTKPSGSRLPMPKSKIATRVGTGIPRRMIP
jgi:hypothetical protein